MHACTGTRTRIRARTHTHFSEVPVHLFLSVSYITLPGFHVAHALHSDWLTSHLVSVCVLLVIVVHNATAGLNMPGSQNYDCMCQSQYLGKPKTLEPVHPSHLPYTCSSSLLFPLPLWVSWLKACTQTFKNDWFCLC